jgi:hypothetical protein
MRGEWPALAPTGHANRRFGMAFREWMRTYGFGTMTNETRKHILVLTENAAAIERFLSSLPERERNRMANPQHIVRRWQASQRNGHGKCLTYVKRDAIAAWKRFVSCVELLPPDQALPLWQAAHAQAAAQL